MKSSASKATGKELKTHGKKSLALHDHAHKIMSKDEKPSGKKK